MTPYELHLLRSPSAALTPAQGAATAALAAADEQAACALHADVFFAWLESALEEEDRAAHDSDAKASEETHAKPGYGQVAYTHTQADALKRALETELGQRQHDIAALAQQWQSIALADDAAHAALESYAATVDASLPPYDSFVAGAHHRWHNSSEAADALHALPDEVAALLQRVAAANGSSGGSGGGVHAAEGHTLSPHLVLPSTSTSRRPDAAVVPRQGAAGAGGVIDAAEEVKRLSSFREFTTELVRHVTADNAAALQAAVAPFTGREDAFLVAGFTPR
jgi:hypothetical protein